MNLFSNFISDPLILISILIIAVASVLIIILSYYYKKLKDEQIISEVVGEKKPKTKNYMREEPQSSSKAPANSKDLDIIIAHLNELTSQITSLSSNVNEIMSLLSSIKEIKSSDNKIEPVAAETIAKLIFVLEKVQSEINSLKVVTQTSATSFDEINKKLDNLLKLLSAILQQ